MTKTIRQIAFFSLLISGLFALSGCPRNEEAAGSEAGQGEMMEQVVEDEPTEVVDETKTAQADPVSKSGSNSSEAAETEAQAPAATNVMTAPYITLGKQTQPGKIELPTGAPLPVYWMLAEESSGTARILLVPQTVSGKGQAENDSAKVDYQNVKSGTQGYVTFFLKQAGEYVFRLYLDDNPASEAVSESEPFTVIPAAAN
jgi:hypothetical protein